MPVRLTSTCCGADCYRIYDENSQPPLTAVVHNGFTVHPLRPQWREGLWSYLSSLRPE